MLAPQCPWSGFAPATMHYCEDNLCAWITAPANTWSNLGFVFVGMYLCWAARREANRGLRLIGPIAIAVGLTSFAYHASFSFIGQVFDLGSMYCFSALLIVMNLRRLGAIGDSKMVPLFLALVLGTVAALVTFKVIGIPLFAAHLIAALELERRAHAKATFRVSYRPFLAALGIFALAFGFWNLDYRRIWCDPSSHVVQGHAIWHVLNSLVFVCVYRFYAQFSSGGQGQLATV